MHALAMGSHAALVQKRLAALAALERSFANMGVGQPMYIQIPLGGEGFGTVGAIEFRFLIRMHYQLMPR